MMAAPSLRHALNPSQVVPLLDCGTCCRPFVRQHGSSLDSNPSPDPSELGFSRQRTRRRSPARATGSGAPLIWGAGRLALSGGTAAWTRSAIVMLLGPSGSHQRNLLVVRRQFDAHSPGGLVPSETRTWSRPAWARAATPI
jgi:hypothetical protein